MGNNKVVNIADISRRSSAREPDAETVTLLNKFKRLSFKEKEALLILIDAFLLQKGASGVKT